MNLQQAYKEAKQEIEIFAHYKMSYEPMVIFRCNDTITYSFMPLAGAIRQNMPVAIIVGFVN